MANKVTSAPSGGDNPKDGKPAIARGLENITVLDSTISHINGTKGELIYAGYDIHDLAENTTFEEVAYLLWKGRLPNQSELDELNAMLRSERGIPEEIHDLLRLMPSDTNPMAAFRTAVSALAAYDDRAEDMSPEANYAKSISLTAKMPTIVAAFDRIRKGNDPVAPSGKGSLAFDFLYMLNGEEPGEAAEKTLDVCLVLHAEHGLNASTFAARVIAATLADIYSAVTGAMGALKGPLHGGANIEVMKMLQEIREKDLDPAQYVKDKLSRKERIMGIGHRVYKTFDPRAASLRDMLVKLSEETGDTFWYDTQMVITKTMEEEKGLYANVDFFSAPVYYMVGIDTDLYTPIFAISRITGWSAHVLEQLADNRLIRPRAEYVGPRDLKVEPISER